MCFFTAQNSGQLHFLFEQKHPTDTLWNIENKDIENAIDKIISRQLYTYNYVG